MGKTIIITTLLFCIFGLPTIYASYTYTQTKNNNNITLVEFYIDKPRHYHVHENWLCIFDGFKITKCYVIDKSSLFDNKYGAKCAYPHDKKICVSQDWNVFSIKSKSTDEQYYVTASLPSHLEPFFESSFKEINKNGMCIVLFVLGVFKFATIGMFGIAYDIHEKYLHNGHFGTWIMLCIFEFRFMAIVMDGQMIGPVNVGMLSWMVLSIPAPLIALYYIDLIEEVINNL